MNLVVSSVLRHLLNIWLGNLAHLKFYFNKIIYKIKFIANLLCLIVYIKIKFIKSVTILYNW